MPFKKTTALAAGVSAIGAMAAVVACTDTESGSDSTETEQAVNMDSALVLPANADLVYAVSGGLGTRAELGTDRVSIRTVLGGRSISLSEDRGIGAVTAELATTAKGHVNYARSRNPRFTLDLFSLPAASSADGTWTPLDGPVINDALAAAGADGTFATVSVHQLRTVQITDLPGGRVYRAVFDARRKVVENAPSVAADSVTNGSWPYRDVIVARGLVDYFAARGSSEAIMLRSAEYRLLTDRVDFKSTTSVDDLRSRVAAGQSYVTVRCLRDGPPAARGALGMVATSGLAIDDCK